jgi:hypothetical protein
LLIKAGTYNERVTIKNIGGTPTASSYFIMGPYGDGEVIINASLNHDLSWSAHTNPNIYKATRTWTQGCGIVVLDNNHLTCRPVNGLANVDSDGDWYHDGTTLYLYTGGVNPTTRSVLVSEQDAVDGYGTHTKNGIVNTYNSGAGLRGIRVYGLTVIGAPSYGIWLIGSASTSTVYNQIEQCKIFYSGGVGIVASNQEAPYLKIIKNYVYGTNMCNYPAGYGDWISITRGDGSQYSWGYAIRVPNYATCDGNIVAWGYGEGIGRFGSSSLGTNATIKNNLLAESYSVNYYLDGAGGVALHDNISFSDPEARVAVDKVYFYWTPGTSNYIDRYRRLHPFGISYADETAPAGTGGHTIYNNLIIGTKNGLNYFDYGVSGAGVKNMIFYHNTIILPNFYDEDIQTGVGLTLTTTDADSVGNIVKNNIFVAQHSTQTLINLSTAGAPGFTFNENQYYHPANSTPFLYGGSYKTFTTWKSSSGKDANSEYGDPLFADGYATITDINIDDLRLTSSSPCKDATAVITGYAIDYDGISRPQDANTDRGIFEYVAPAGDSTAPSAVSTLSAEVGTNPGEVDLSWTSVGDDAGTGTASVYDIRYSIADISSDALFTSASQVSGESAPQAAGNAETYTVTGLVPGTTYYFAMKVSDEVANTSALSNRDSAEATPYPSDAIAVATVASATNSNTNSLSFSIELPDAPHRSVVVKVATEDSSATDGVVSSVILNGVATTGIEDVVIGAYNRTYSFFIGEEQLPVAPGSYTITITTGGAVWNIIAGAVCTYATVQTTPTLHTDSTASNSTISTTIDTTPSDNVLLIDAVQANVGSVTGFTATGMTEVIDIDGATGTLAVSTRFVASPAEVTNTWTVDPVSTNNLGHVIIGLAQFVPSPDTTAPAAVVDLAAVRGGASGSAIVSWTAPGDDDRTGTAASYDLRRSTATITEANWAAATTIAGEPSPSAAGATESLALTGLSGTVYFALKTTDNDSNVSTLSNVASVAVGTIVQNTGGCYGSVR